MYYTKKLRPYFTAVFLLPKMCISQEILLKMNLKYEI